MLRSTNSDFSVADSVEIVIDSTSRHLSKLPHRFQFIIVDSCFMQTAVTVAFTSNSCDRVHLSKRFSKAKAYDP